MVNSNDILNRTYSAIYQQKINQIKLKDEDLKSITDEDINN